MRDHEAVLTSWKENPQLTRREFLGLSLRAAAGLALSGTALSLLGSCGGEATPPHNYTRER